MTEDEITQLLVRRVGRNGTSEVLCTKAHAEIMKLRQKLADTYFSLDVEHSKNAECNKEINRLRSEAKENLDLAERHIGAEVQWRPIEEYDNNDYVGGVIVRMHNEHARWLDRIALCDRCDFTHFIPLTALGEPKDV
jgi:hypothetical protein